MRLSHRAFDRLFRIVVLIPILAASVGPVRAQTARDQGPGTPDILLAQAIRFAGDGRHEEAVSVLKPLTSATTDSAPSEVFLWLGRSQLSLGNTAAAREAFTRYLELNPSDSDGLLGLARAHRQEGNAGEALAAYRKMSLMGPSSDIVRRELRETEQALTGIRAATLAPATADGAGSSFWHNGIAGVCGARTVWWGRLIAVVVFLFGMIQAGATVGAQILSSMRQAGTPGAAPAVAFFSAAISLAISYILFWGVPPDALGYGLMAIDWLLMGSIAAGIAAND